MQKILITGSSGFIGINLVNHLSKKNIYNIIGIDIKSLSVSAYNSKNINFCFKDIGKINNKDLLDVDIVIHLAAIKKHNASTQYEEFKLITTNIKNTYKLFNLAKKSKKVKKIIFASSLYANGNLHKKMVKESDKNNPRTLYGASKLFGENILSYISENSNIKCISLRLYFIYGNSQYDGSGYPSVFYSTLEKLHHNTNPEIRNDGNQELDYLHVDDLCKLIEKIIRSNNLPKYMILNASSSKTYKIKDIIKIITNNWNQKFHTKFKPIFKGQDFTNGTFRSGSNNKAKKMFNWNPKISIKNGIKNYIEWFIDYKG